MSDLVALGDVMITHPRGVWTVDVGWADARPIVPDARTTRVQVAAHDEHEAALVAAQMVCAIGGGRGGCEMPTSTRIVEVEF